MVDVSNSPTPVSLLERLRRPEMDEAAWNEFVDRYGRKVYCWCQRWGLQEADAADVTQNVLLALARQMRTFKYDGTGSFRSWLKTVASRAWSKFLQQRQRGGMNDGNTMILESLCSLPAREELAQKIEEEGERELLEVAMARVRKRVQPHTWEAFRLLAVEGVSGAEAARRMGVPIGSAYVAKRNVQLMLKAEVQKMGLGD